MRKLQTRLYGSTELARVVGKRIQAFRRERRWRREHLASLLEIKMSWLESYEEGRTLPPTYTLYQLAGAFSVSVSALLDDAPHEQPLSLDEALSLLRQVESLSAEDRRAVSGFLRTILDAMTSIKNR